MRPTELIKELVICMKAGLPVMLKGAPGVGKSDLVQQVSVITKMDLEINHPVVADPTDPKGMPCIVKDPKTGEDVAVFLPFGFLLRLINAKRPTIAFLDDLGQAPAVVQAAYMQLILARRVNGHKISDHVVFIAATNRREDMAGVTSVLEPVKSRFATIIELEPNVEDWIEWAIDNHVPPELIGFIHFRPNLLTEGAATRDIVNHPCPRTIYNAGRLMKAGTRNPETLAGAIGEAAAGELIGFLEVCDALPNLDDVINDPKNTIVPTEPSALYATVTGLVERIDEDNADSIFEYISRFPKDVADLGTFLVRDGGRKNPNIKQTKGYINWIAAHKDIML